MSQTSTEKPAVKATATKNAAVDPGASQDELQSLKGTAPDSESNVVLGADDTVSASHYDETDANTFVTLTKDVVEEFYFPDTRRPSYRVLYHAGQVVNKKVLDAYNQATEQAKALRKTGGVDPKNPAGIDSTTLASGTKVAGDFGKKD